ncbi:alpha/beta fold hydrolase [Achromobacter ruhlandii]|nr:alpha/beta fold hydrolase [Achromobacter ruhlandii]
MMADTAQDPAFAAILDKYFAITRVPYDAFTRAFLGRCQSFSVKANGAVYKYYRRGAGPTVVLAHGIHSHLGSMVPIAEQLLELGYEVVLFDMPAHGEAAGSGTDPVQVRDFIRKVCARLGEVHAVVSHSLGGLWALSAMHQGFRADAFVSISTPSTTRFLVEKFVQLNQLDGEVETRLCAELERRYGATLWTDYAPRHIVGALDVPGLVIHGANDDFVPPAHAQELYDAWPGATLEIVDGAGHFEILGLAGVGKRVGAYLREVPVAAAA